MIVPYPSELEDHKEEWVAVSKENHLVGYGKSPREAMVMALVDGHSPKNCLLVWVPDEWPGFKLGAAC